MISINHDAKTEADRLVNLVLSCKIAESGNKPPQGVGRRLAKVIARKILDEKEYPEDYKQKIFTYLGHNN
jgi:hypothetical protein